MAVKQRHAEHCAVIRPDHLKFASYGPADSDRLIATIFGGPEFNGQICDYSLVPRPTWSGGLGTRLMCDVHVCMHNHMNYGVCGQSPPGSLML